MVTYLFFFFFFFEYNIEERGFSGELYSLGAKTKFRQSILSKVSHDVLDCLELYRSCGGGSRSLSF
jgi:hypothetical protein